MPGPTLDSTLGAIEIGTFISLCLFGVTAVQLYTYYQSNFSHDGRPLRILIITVCFLETIHTAFISAYVYISTISHFGDLEKLQIAHWTLGFSIPIANLVMVLVQSFFAYRVYGLSHKWQITAISWFGSLVRMGTALAIAIISHIQKELSPFIAQYRWLLIVSLVVGAAIDVLNTSALCFYLYVARGEITKSRRMIETLMLWTIETGLLTSICNIISLILLLAMPQTTSFLCLSMFLAKMYSNSLLASLNGRLTLRTTGAQSQYTLTTVLTTGRDQIRNVRTTTISDTVRISESRLAGSESSRTVYGVKDSKEEEEDL